MIGRCVSYQGSNENVSMHTGYDYAQIYTDWANYYLERTKSKKKVTDLSTDCRDGLLLADVIEAVTSFKVSDLIKKPKNSQQMRDNVGLCLDVLRAHSVGGVEAITPEDVYCGKLKAILALFFALSRYKQQYKQSRNNSFIGNSKHQQQQHPQSQDQRKEQSSVENIAETSAMSNRPFAVTNTKGNNLTAIPLPSTVPVQRRGTHEKVRPLPPTPNQTSPLPSLNKSNINCNNRPNSPPSSNSNLNSQKVVSNGLRPPSQCKSDLYVNVSENNASTKNTYGKPQDISDVNVAPIVIMANSNANNKSSKQSMLEKLKLFHNDKLSSANVSLSTKFNSSKRTSSSSGISSARSEKSDSSLSLNDTHKLQMKAPTSQRIKESKNSKLYPQKQSISANSRSKTEVKDKSPARKLLVEENKTVGTLKSEIKTKSGSKTLLSKLRPRSEPKQSLIAIPKPIITPNNSNGTSIPKPVAAVKGTSKLAPSINTDAKFPSESTDSSTLTLEKKNISKTKSNISEHNKIVHDNNRISNQQIVMPLTDIRQQNHSLSDSLTSINTTHRSCNESSVKLKTDIRSKGYNLSNEHSQEFKNQYKYQFTNSPVHYQQQLSENPNKRQEQHSYPKKLISKTYGEEKSSNVLPMRPMLRGYNSHLTLPSRSSLGKQHCVAEFFDLDTNHGYCSDGDILRRGYNQVSAQSRLSDVENGYLSEGGGVGHGKNILSLMKTRMQLPTTIEEKFRSNHSLESIDKIEVPMTCGDKLNMDINSFGVKREDWVTNNEGTTDDKLLNTPRQNALLKQSMSSSSSSRSKGVPRSFGSITRLNGSSTAGTIITSSSEANPNNILLSGRTAHVSAMPRSGKMKASSNTTEMPKKSSASNQHRSFSLTGPGAIQLSQSIRERLSNGSHSLPKPGTDLQALQHRISNHVTGKILDGSLSDTQTYAEVKPEYSTYAMWLKHSNTAGCRLSEGDSLENVTINSPNMSRQSHKVIHRGGESMFSQSPRINRSNSIRSTKSEKMYPSMLSRGHDIESEPYYCLPIGAVVTNQSSRTNAAAVPWSQPTSPTPANRSTLSGVAGNFNGPLSPTQGCPFTMNSCQRLTYPKKNDEVHGSAASLLSGGSSLYSSAEERQANEIRRLKRELADAKDQVMSLSSQLSTNAHVVTAFEQSLGNMTSRLQHLTATAERKDSELTDMRQTIELLRKQSIQAGLTTAHMQSMGVQTNNQCDLKCKTRHQHQFKKPYSSFQPNSIDDNKSNSHIPSTSSPYSHKQCNTNQANANAIIQRHHSSDSMCSLNSISSNCSVLDKKKKKGWLRSSFTKAFSRNAKISKTNRHTNGGFSNNSEQTESSSMPPAPNSSTLRQQPQATQHNSKRSISSPTHSILNTVTVIENAKPIDAIEVEENTVVEDLKKQLREKDLVLTDIRLEALSSASQLESLKDTVMKMRAEMISLKQNNEKLQKLVTSRSLAGSESSIGHAISPNGTSNESRRYSLADGSLRPPMDLPKSLEEEVEEENIPPAPAPEPPPSLNLTTHIDLTPPPPAIEQVPSPNHLPNSVEDVPDVTDGKKLAICVYLGQPESFSKYNDDILESDDFYSSEQKHSTNDDLTTKSNLDIGPNEQKTFPKIALNEFVIAYTYISGKTTWQNLDYIVRKTFKDYVSRIDPGTNLGLNTDSITSYHLGEAKRGPEMGFPELLPCGYIVGNVRSLYICLQGVGSLAFDSLIPRSIIHRYISLLTEHRRLILCGPSGTGKSYLARRLAEFLVARVGRGSPSEAIATFNVDHKSSKELRQYLSHIAEQASMGNSESELPSVIILDNLHHASALGDVFSCLLSSGSVANLPCIIGTMSQATCNTTNLQLHHNFRWVLTANHMEPVKGFLGRFLRRRLFIIELQTLNHQPELASVLAWLPTVWQHINRFLENHSSSDVTIGPRLFLSCPLDLKDSQVWFTDIWNYHLAPYLIEAVREGVQLYGRRGGAWNDPSTFICDTYPWSYGPESVAPLRQVNAEDVGLEGNLSEQTDSQDPLLNMLMRLQEAANYSEIQEQESDCASLDSNVTPESSAGGAE